MTNPDYQEGLQTATIGPSVTAVRLLAPLYGVAVFLSAGLIFWIEPLFAKMILPSMGGTPAVWITALMFYQAVLFVGYLYAHLLVRIGSIARQAMAHLLFMAAAATLLPPRLPALPEILAGQPAAAVLFLLTVGIGPPLLVLAATAPLLQRWFSHSGHPDAADPYFLYAASNIGSLGLLLAFPLAIEPAAGIGSQTAIWSGGFALAAALVLGSGTLAGRFATARPAAPPPEAPPGAEIPARWKWLLLAAVPSSLLSGTTTRITTDVAAGPLFWVIPLALYLLTFILAFSRRRWLPLRVALPLQAALLAPVVVAAFGGAKLFGEWTVGVASLLLLFVSAYLCHLRLVETRPQASRLTEFYLFMAAGGMLGGTFNALVAPVLFDDVHEYPLALALAVALRPALPGSRDGRLSLATFALPATLGLAASAVIATAPADQAAVVHGLTGAALAFALILLAGNRERLTGGLAAVFLVATLPDPALRALHIDRNFFGVVQVMRDAQRDANVFVSGSTVHGIQSRDPARATQPTSYYHRSGPLGDVFRIMGDRIGGDDVAVIGLGVGTIACYGDPAARWAFYEINPAVQRLATDQGHFTFLDRCQANARLMLGDGRLRFAEEAGPYRLIILDAFSSDSVPTHLLTREAFQTYAERLAPDGLIVANVSNRFVDLRPTLGAMARSLEYEAATRIFVTDLPLATSSEWVAMGRTEVVAPFRAAGWSAVDPGDAPVWTDDFTDLLYPILARLRR